MASPPERDRRCLCVKCLAQGPEGMLVSAHTFRLHEKKRSLDDSGHLDELLLRPAGDQSQFPTFVPQDVGTEPALIEARLRLQAYRYDILLLSASFQRPLRLEFASRCPKARLTPSSYSYCGILNQAPYDLTQSPINADLLAAERKLHELAQNLAHMRSSLHWDPNIQMQLRSVEKEAVSFLNKLFSWKVEIRHEEGQQNPLSVPLVVDTSRYLLFYQEQDPVYSKFVLAGLLLVLVLHLVFNGSQSLCEVVLGLLHDQIDILATVIGAAKAAQLSKSIPRTVKGVLPLFDLDPVVNLFIVCPRCYDITPLKAEDNPSNCTHKGTPASPECGAKLTRKRVVNGKDVVRPIKEYCQQVFVEWQGRFICRPDIETLLRKRKEEYRNRRRLREQGDPEEPTLVSDILDSKGLQEFTWPDGKGFYDCDDDEYRLFFSFTIDGFSANMNREVKATTTSTAIYLFCLNLPLEERYKPHNVFLAGVIPGPDKPSTSQINKYVDLVVDEFVPLYDSGVRYTKTTHCPDGASARSALLPVVCDTLGARQACGYGAVTSKYFCTFCWLPLQLLENFNKASWPLRDLDGHRHWAMKWNEAPDESTRQQLFEEHGIRYTPLFRLPYFDPIMQTLLDSMHAFFLNLFQRHCRYIWGMDMDIADGDGEFRLQKRAPAEPSIGKMRAARKALEFNDVLGLTKTNKHVLFYLCLELDLRRGGKKRDLIRELLRWRNQQGAYLPAAWGNGEDETEQDAPVATILPVPGPLPMYATGSRSGTSHLPIALPAELSAERVESAESALARGLKLDGIRNDVLLYMCMRRNLPLPMKALKKDMIAALTDSNVEQHSAIKKQKRKHKATVVLGRAVLTAVASDMERLSLPRWVDPAPIRAGQKKQGKLSADQWRSFCSIHLVITLIRLWGREPEDSRWYQMLLNFLDLVVAVELGSMVVTSPQHIQAYETVITRYLVRMKQLYKEAVIVPSHHLALHIPDYQAYWGPSPQSRGFGWERNNHTLQQINTNKRFGDLEKTFMFASTRAANLLALLRLEKIRDIVKNMYAKIQKLINADSRGTRVHDVLERPLGGSSSVNEGKSFVLEPHLAQKLSSLVSEGTSLPQNVYPSATLIYSVKEGGATYRPYSRSSGDSQVLLPSQSPLGYQPARIEMIFTHRRVIDGNIQGETFLVVRDLQPLPEGVVERDWFRRFGRTGGSLWSTAYDDDSKSRVVRASSAISHFACTSFDPSDTDLGPTYHVLPLDRLKTQIENAGESVRDATFDDIFGVINEGAEEEEESDDGDTDDDMDIDM